MANWSWRVTIKNSSSSCLNLILGERPQRWHRQFQSGCCNTKKASLSGAAQALALGFACSKWQSKPRLLADWTAARERAEADGAPPSLSWTGRGKGVRKSSFVHRFTNKYKKKIIIIFQDSTNVNTVPWCQLHSACLHREKGNSSLFPYRTQGSALFKMLW